MVYHVEVPPGSHRSLSADRWDTPCVVSLRLGSSTFINVETSAGSSQFCVVLMGGRALYRWPSGENRRHIDVELVVSKWISG